MKNAWAARLRDLGAAIAKIRVSLARVLLGNLPLAQESPPPDEPAKRLVDKLRNPGIDCPKCGSLIRVDIETLIARAPLVCPNPGCRLTLEIDSDKSRESLEALHKFQESMAAAERIRRQAAP